MYALEVVVKVAQVANCTRSYTQMNWEKLLVTAAHYVSAVLSMQLNQKIPAQGRPTEATPRHHAE